VAGLDRRDFLKGTAAVTGGLVAGLGAGAAPSGVWARPAAAATGPVRVYVVVIDGLRPGEVALMPQVSALAAAGTHYPHSRAQMVAETTPNHLSMLTGMRSERHGMPGNAVPFLSGRVSDDRRYLQADSILTLARRQAPDLRTVSVTAKSYLVESQKHDRTGDGAEDATATNTTLLNVPGSDSAPDVETGTEAVMRSAELDPDFLFLNLGDVDRVGHVDETGALTDGVAPVARTATLLTADLQVRRLVEELTSSGRWDTTVMIITADHSMDWSFRTRNLNLQPAFEADPLLAGEVVAAVNGGACMYALRSPDEPRAGERLARMRAIAVGTEGIDEALYIRPNAADGGDRHAVGRVHPDWGLVGDRTGDLIVTCAPGWRIGHSSVPTQSNPIPGNHGHPATLPIPVIVSGGWSGLAAPRVVEPARELGLTDRDPGQAENIDVAPTVAWLLGLNPPPGGFDGRVLTEAFRERPAPRVEVRNVVSLPVPRRLAGRNRFGTAAVLSALAFPDGADRVVVASGEAFADALAATPLAIALGAPLLLAGRGGLPPETAAEVARLGATSAIVVGGTGVLGEAVDAGLSSAGVGSVERIAGPDR
jgi:ectonucleotide pyrophosphatase/phosphodiesterase family member 5